MLCMFDLTYTVFFFFFFFVWINGIDFWGFSREMG